MFTEKDGNVKIALPLAAEKKYTIKFFDDSNMPVLEIKQIKDILLTLDKSNFIHAGWFKFELYEDGVMKEKHKICINTPKDLLTRFTILHIKNFFKIPFHVFACLRNTTACPVPFE